MEKASISQAIKQICDEKGIPYEAVLETIESALAAAYRKDFGNKMQNIKVKFNPDTSEIKAFDVKTVAEDLPPEELMTEDEYGEPRITEARKTMAAPNEDDKPQTVEIQKEMEAQTTGIRKTIEIRKETAALNEAGKPQTPEARKEVETQKSEPETILSGPEEKTAIEGTAGEAEKIRFNPRTMIQLSEAKEIDNQYKIGDEIITPLPVPGAFGRMAAQTAKQVIIQKLREAERDILYSEYKEKEGQVLTGTIQRCEGRLVLVDFGRVTAIMLPDGQISNENYLPGQHLKVYLVSVEKTTKGPEIIVSRAHPYVVKKLFETEIPEIANGAVEIKGIAREAGLRTKIAVYTADESIDPIGSCIGQRGARVQTIIAELKGEKIDIIQYVDEPAKYIANAMSPAKISEIKIDEKTKSAVAAVAEDQLSLAIGRGGQNVRLASQLTGWKIDIVQAEVKGEKGKQETEETKVSAVAKVTGETKEKKEAKKEKETKAEQKNHVEKKETQEKEGEAKDKETAKDKKKAEDD